MYELLPYTTVESLCTYVTVIGSRLGNLSETRENHVASPSFWIQQQVEAWSWAMSFVGYITLPLDFHLEPIC